MSTLHPPTPGACRHEVTTADSVDRSISPADEEALRECVRRYFPVADGRLASATTCTFTNTPDGHFILDRHPRWPQVGDSMDY